MMRLSNNSKLQTVETLTHRLEVDLERSLDENGREQLEADRVVTLPRPLPYEKNDDTTTAQKHASYTVAINQNGMKQRRELSKGPPHRLVTRRVKFTAKAFTTRHCLGGVEARPGVTGLACFDKETPTDHSTWSTFSNMGQDHGVIAKHPGKAHGKHLVSKMSKTTI